MIGDTIAALASAPGPGARAVLRLSGPRARQVAARVFAPALPAARAAVDGCVEVLQARLPAMALVMPGPQSFTGEDVVELHVPGSPVLVGLLTAELQRDGAVTGVRAALPGEFTARAYRNGRLSAAAVEGLLMLLHAADRRAVHAAAQWLTGDRADAIAAVRAHLQDALAALEAGLDFEAGELGELPAAAWRGPLAAAAARLDGLRGALPVVPPGGEVLLLGRANAGKSSLANALAGRTSVIVDGAPGTTRDLIAVELASGAQVLDAPGDLDAPDGVDAAALALRDRLAGRSGALLVVLDATQPVVPRAALDLPLPWFGVVWTKVDAVPALPPLPAAVAARRGTAPVFATSAVRGDGIAALRDQLCGGARRAAVDAGEPLRTALAAAAAAVQRALAAADAGAELVAVDLQAALRALDGIAGQHDPERLLDRIYGRFCLGK